MVMSSKERVAMVISSKERVAMVIEPLVSSDMGVAGGTGSLLYAGDIKSCAGDIT